MSSFLPAGELAMNRRDTETTLGGLCDIQRTTLVPDGMGGQTPSTAIVANDVPCRVGPPKAVSESVGGGAFGGNIHRDVTLPAETEIEPDDVILFAGRSLQVIGGAQDRTDEILRRIEVAESAS